MALKDKKELTPAPPPEESKAEVKETPEVKGKDKGTTPELADRWEGKSQEELLQIVRDQDKQIGDQSTVIGTQKKDLEYLESRDSQTQTPQGQPQGQFQTPQQQSPYGAPYDPYGGYQGYGQPQYPNPQPPQEPTPQFDFERAGESVQSIVQREMGKERARRDYEEVQKYRSEVRGAYDEGRQKAFRSNPKLFQGIEREVADGIAGIAQRNMMSPADLRSEETWKLAGQVARFKRGEMGYLKEEAPPSMPAPHSETPASIGEETMVPVELNPQEQAWKRMTGLTDEDVQEIKKGKK